jgi:hypothetical protein
LSKRAAKDPSTIFGDMGELGPMFASRRDVPNDSFFSFISAEKIKQYFSKGTVA